MLGPIYTQYERRVRFMPLDDLRKELDYLEHPSTDNRITLAVLATKADMVREEIKAREAQEPQA